MTKKISIPAKITCYYIESQNPGFGDSPAKALASVQGEEYVAGRNQLENLGSFNAIFDNPDSLIKSGCGL